MQVDFENTYTSEIHAVYKSVSLRACNNEQMENKNKIGKRRKPLKALYHEEKLCIMKIYIRNHTSKYQGIQGTKYQE